MRPLIKKELSIKDSPLYFFCSVVISLSASYLAKQEEFFYICSVQMVPAPTSVWWYSWFFYISYTLMTNAPYSHRRPKWIYFESRHEENSLSSWFYYMQSLRIHKFTIFNVDSTDDDKELERIPDCSAHLKVAGSDVRTPQYMTSRGLSIHN